jgi:hypothetical protein
LETAKASHSPLGVVLEIQLLPLLLAVCKILKFSAAKIRLMPTMEQLGSSSEVTVSKPDAQESLNLPSPRQRQQSQVGINVSRQTQDSRVLKLKGKKQTIESAAHAARRLTSIPATVLGRWLVSCCAFWWGRAAGLPYSTSEKDIIDFFGEGFSVTEVAFVYEPDGRPSGLVSLSRPGPGSLRCYGVDI